jgi:HEAT repeat protein
MCRRTLLTLLSCLLVLVSAGCGESTKTKRAQLPRLPGSPQSSPRQAAKRPKGPQTMGNLMVDAWQKDLADASPDKRIRAARELGNMGSSAKSALPALQKAAGDPNKDVASAAKAAMTSIGKK